MRRIGPFLRDAWALARPYWQGEDRWRGRLLLAAVVALNLALVGMAVLLSYWQRAFYDALEARDQQAFVELLFWGRKAEGLPLPGFAWVAAAYILAAVYALYLRQALQIRWRRWLTRRYLDRWLDRRAYYRMALADPATDNPDQRIADDVRLFVDSTLALGLGLMNSAVTLFSFVFVLWGLSGPLTVLGLTIPGYMVWAALLYAVLGMWLAHLIGRPLIGLSFSQRRAEADLRYALVRLRENAEGVALYAGEADEKRGLLARFHALVENWRGIMAATKRLTFFTAGYAQVAAVFPIVVAAPAYFAGRIHLGGLIQTSSAFGQVQGALSWFVDNYSALADWRATVERLPGATMVSVAHRPAVARFHDRELRVDGGRLLPAQPPPAAATPARSGSRSDLRGVRTSGGTELWRPAP